jgi:hypothetical protein
MRPALLRACALSFFNRAASRFAPRIAAARERYREWRKPQTFTCHQPVRSTTSILIFIAEAPTLKTTSIGCIAERRHRIAAWDLEARKFHTCHPGRHRRHDSNAVQYGRR